MKISTLFLVGILNLNGAFAGESMQQMPRAIEKRVITVTGEENFEALLGFGGDASEVRMMNLMMVEGSGMEGMDMSGMNMSPPETLAVKESGVANSSPFEVQIIKPLDSPSVGTNRLDFRVLDPKTKQAVAGLKLESQVFMTEMDMGTEEPKVREMEPGHYRVDVPFAMRGTWVVRIHGNAKDQKGPSRVWENLLKFKVETPLKLPRRQE